MKITQEMKDYEQFGAQQTLIQLEDAAQEIKKKHHIISVLSVIDSLHELRLSPEFRYSYAKFIMIEAQKNYGAFKYLSLKLTTGHGSEIYEDQEVHVLLKYAQFIQKYKDIQTQCMSLKSEYLSTGLLNDKFDFNESGIKSLQNHLLNSELKIVVEQYLINKFAPKEIAQPATAKPEIKFKI